MSKLVVLMKRLGMNVDLEAAYKQGREGVARQVGCKDEEVTALLNMDSAWIGQSPGLNNGKLATDLSIKACDH